MKKITVIFTLVVVAMVMVGGAWASEAGKVNINKAAVEELVQLKGVGQKYAEKIVAFRQANGDFANPEDLMKVPGIGTKIFENNKHRITVN